MPLLFLSSVCSWIFPESSSHSQPIWPPFYTFPSHLFSHSQRPLSSFPHLPFSPLLPQPTSSVLLFTPSLLTSSPTANVLCPPFHTFPSHLFYHSQPPPSSFSHLPFSPLLPQPTPSVLLFSLFLLASSPTANLLRPPFHTFPSHLFYHSQPPPSSFPHLPFSPLLPQPTPSVLLSTPSLLTSSPTANVLCPPFHTFPSHLFFHSQPPPSSFPHLPFSPLLPQPTPSVLLSTPSLLTSSPTANPLRPPFHTFPSHLFFHSQPPPSSFPHLPFSPLLPQPTPSVLLSTPSLLTSSPTANPLRPPFHTFPSHLFSHSQPPPSSFPHLPFSPLLPQPTPFCPPFHTFPSRLCL